MKSERVVRTSSSPRAVYTTTIARSGCSDPQFQPAQNFIPAVYVTGMTNRCNGRDTDAQPSYRGTPLGITHVPAGGSRTAVCSGDPCQGEAGDVRRCLGLY